MAMPVPQFDGQIGLWPLSNERKQLQKSKRSVLRHGRLSFGHSDWAGYSVFEEAFTMGHWAA